MIAVGDVRLSRSQQPVIMRNQVTFAALLLSLAAQALAQQSPSPTRDNAGQSAPDQKRARDDLDVTMQIIVDPDAKLPDEVVRRIPLPARKPDALPAAAKEPAGKGEQPDRGRSEAARELARERSQQASEQREQARRSVVEERRRNPGPPSEPPRRPETPPRN